MRVGVTGAGGFTGRYVMRTLRARGDDPVSLDADLTDADAVAREVREAVPEAVIHLAGRAFVAASGYDGFYAVNQIGTFHLLDALAGAVPGIPVLLASSAQVYGPHAHGLVDEENEPRPNNHYALSKMGMEIGSRFWSDRLRLMIARPFNYTGVDQEIEYLIPKIVSHFRRRAEVIELGNIDVKRDFGDVRAVAEAYCSLIARPIAGDVVNIASGEVISVRDVVAMLEEMTGHRMTITVNPAFVRKNDVPVLGGANARLRGWLPAWRPIPLGDTLRWMVDA